MEYRCDKCGSKEVVLVSTKPPGKERLVLCNEHYNEYMKPKIEAYNRLYINRVLKKIRKLVGKDPIRKDEIIDRIKSEYGI